MGKPKAPEPPDPRVTAGAQTGTNVTTALANARLGNVNQYGPDGSVTYSQNGGEVFTDPSTGAQYFVPQYEQTTRLSHTQQQIKDSGDLAQLGLANLARDQTARISNVLSQPFSLDGLPERGQFDRDFSDDRQRVEDALFSRMEPRLSRDRESLRTQLVNQGIGIGSEAYTRAMGDFGQNVNDARTAAILAAGQEQSRLANLDLAGAQFADSQRGQAMQERFASRNQPINEITALMSGSQVSMPQFGAAAPNQPRIPTVDYAGLVNENFNQKMGIYNQQMSQRQNLLGGLFGLGAAVISDRRKKKDIKKVGSLKGHSLYEYRYRGDMDDGDKHIGVMAQNVERRRPDAVVTYSDGTKAVKYGELFGAGAA